MHGSQSIDFPIFPLKWNADNAIVNNWICELTILTMQIKIKRNWEEPSEQNVRETTQDPTEREWVRRLFDDAWAWQPPQYINQVHFIMDRSVMWCLNLSSCALWAEYTEQTTTFERALTDFIRFFIRSVTGMNGTHFEVSASKSIETKLFFSCLKSQSRRSGLMVRMKDSILAKILFYG